MRKREYKKLYTLYTIKGDCDQLINNIDHKLISYCNGEGTFIKYYDNMHDWILAIHSNEFKDGFGLEINTEDRKHLVRTYRYDLRCEKQDSDKVKIMANIIEYYYSDTYYYNIKTNTVRIRTELTGHTYYNSPYESCDSCGTCDGARCDSCMKKYIIYDINSDIEYYSGFDENEATRIKEELKESYLNIISDILSNYNIDNEWFEKEIGNASDYKALLKILNKYEIPYSLS